MAKVLIATIYTANPVMLAITKLSPDRVYLLVDEESDKEQQAAVKLIQSSLGQVIDIKTKKTKVYDIVDIATKCVELIDDLPNGDIVYVNITSGRKTKAIGLLLAAYARHDKVKKIAYNPEEDKSTVVYLPRLSMKLTESQKQILCLIEKKKYASVQELAKDADMSTAMLYRAVGELEDMDMIEAENGYKLTDAGKIARL
ncbi:MAG: CRISPR-associated CARF protein Csa3 [Candidatus Woesearchaeota archaeon]